MINSNAAAPLFWYIYRPSIRRSGNDDGGFNVALYPNHTLVYCRYNRSNQIVEQSTFQLGAEFTEYYLAYLQGQAIWMGEVPLEIGVNGNPQYASMFGFAGHPMFEVDEIDTLVLAPFNSLRGMYARHLRSVLEAISAKLYTYGIGLTVDSFVWDWKKIQPIGPYQQQMQMVEPAPAQMPEAEDELYDVAQ